MKWSSARSIEDFCMVGIDSSFSQLGRQVVGFYTLVLQMELEFHKHFQSIENVYVLRKSIDVLQRKERERERENRKER